MMVTSLPAKLERAYRANMGRAETLRREALECAPKLRHAKLAAATAAEKLALRQLAKLEELS